MISAAGKKLLLLIMVAMMIIAVLGETIPTSSSLESYTQLENNQKSTVTTTTIATNNTQSVVALRNNQYVTVYSLAGYAWNYYYIDVSANSYVSITHATRAGGNMEILMNYYGNPTVNTYSKKAAMSSYYSVLNSDAKSYSNRVYIAVRNTVSYSSSGYTFSVRIMTNNPTTPTTPTTTTVYRTNNALALALGIPALVIASILLIVVLSQIKKIKALTTRVEQLEKKLQYNMQPLSEQEMMPVMMNVPLMSANTLQQDHEDIQQQTQPMTQTTNAVPEQQPTTIPQNFTQFVQQQQLPPQFRNAQPYPFMYPPQVVYAQPQQVQPVNAQQPTGQSKQ